MRDELINSLIENLNETEADSIEWTMITVDNLKITVKVEALMGEEE